MSKPQTKKVQTKKPPVKQNAPTKAKTGEKTSKDVPKTVPGTDLSNAKPNLQEPHPKVTSERELAVILLQRHIRQLLAKNRREKLIQKRKKYENEIERLERDAFIRIAKEQQKIAEAQQLKHDNAVKRRKDEVKRKKQFLEAAFDGELAEMDNILRQQDAAAEAEGVTKDGIGRIIRDQRKLAIIEGEDTNGNSPLSEASAGGQDETIIFLASRGADPNRKGQYDRTPLYRAAFAGHSATCETLLNLGADPRIHAEDGLTPAYIAANDQLKEFIESWDVAVTERLLKDLDRRLSKRKEEEDKRKKLEADKTEGDIETVEKECERNQKQVEQRYCLLAQHEENYNLCPIEKRDLAVHAIHDAEFQLEVAKCALEKSKDKLSMLRLEQAEQKSKSSEMPGLKVNLRQLDDILLRDVGGRMAESGKWPLIIDQSGQASTFLRYRDTNYVNALNLKQMEPEYLRMALLGSLRYGKPFVVDLMETDVLNTSVRMRFDELVPNFLDSIMDKSFIKERTFLKLLRKSDPKDYEAGNFADSRLANFKFVVLTKFPFPSAYSLENCFVITIVVS